MLHSKIEILKNNEKISKRIKEEIKRYESLNFKESRLNEIEEKILFEKKEKKKLEEKNLEINSALAALENKILECAKLERKMQNLEVCPTCYQNVDAVYRANILNKNHNEMSNAKKEIEELELKRVDLHKRIKEKEIQISSLEENATEIKILRMKMEGLKEKELRISEILNQNISLEKDIELLNNQVRIIKNDLFSLSKYDLIFEEKSKELALALKEEKVVEINLAELRREIEVFEESNKELEFRIEKIEKIKEKLAHITELENWLNKKFIPIISFIERNVMGSLKYEFSRLFSEWFNKLVPENFNVRLLDSFTPIIEQQDYEIDYSYLSGGERTAIALAYRLALNQVINSLMSKIKTKDLVILDEPTDGFSDQQLDKMREVLDELNVKQLIIVSHEQKIEGFVENIIRFKKEYGISRKEDN